MVQVRYTRNLFLRQVCVIYLFAFLSLYIQIPGLYGDNGILPAKTQLDFGGRTSLLQKFQKKPTLLWLAPYIGLNVEYMLDVLSLLGVILSFVGFVWEKMCIAPMFLGLWTLYYSLYQVGQVFMVSQWDVLLLEVGFLCIFVAPFWHTRANKGGTPSDALTFWTVRWLLFRLVFSSGVVKLMSKCPMWWSLKALNVHFESQCIPTSLAWYAHHLPTWFLRLTTVATNVTELVIPFLFFFPNRKVRIVAFYIQVFWQINIMATGNYNFFNFLTICLCMSLLDDQFFFRKKSKSGGSNVNDLLSTMVCLLVYAGVVYGTCKYYNLKISDAWTILSEIAFTFEQFEEALSKAVPISIVIGTISFGFRVIDSITNSITSNKGTRSKITNTFVTLLYSAITGTIFALSIVPYSTILPSHESMIPAQLKQIYSKIEHYHIVHSYGLFRHMTGVEGRPEIIIEGGDSLYGPWKEYEFLYKPGNVQNPLPFVAPHQPRLDWQMWFASLANYNYSPWLISFVYRLLNGQPEVLALMNTVENPFKDKPPKYIRANLYHYHYTPWSQTWNSNTWWTREMHKKYLPVLSLDHPPLMDYLTEAKILENKPTVEIINEPLKLVLDYLRSLVRKVEASLLLWGVFTAGCVIILTKYSSYASKKK